MPTKRPSSFDFDEVDDSIHQKENHAEFSYYSSSSSSSSSTSFTHPSDSSSLSHPHYYPISPHSPSPSSSSSMPIKRNSKDHSYKPISQSKKKELVNKFCSDLTPDSTSKQLTNCIIAKHSDDPSWDPSVLNPASARRAKSLKELGLDYQDKPKSTAFSSKTSFHSSVGRKGETHLGLGLIQPSRNSLQYQKSKAKGLESLENDSQQRLGDSGETSDSGRRWYDAQLGSSNPTNKYIEDSNDNSDLVYSSAFPNSQRGLHLGSDFKHPLSDLNPLSSKSGFSKSILDDDALLSVPSWNRRPRTEPNQLRQRARDLTGRWTWRWSPGQGWKLGRSKDWSAYQLQGGVGNAMAALLPPSQPAGLSFPPIIPHQSNSLFYSFLFASLFIMFLITLILEDFLGFKIPSPIPTRTLGRIGRRVPLPTSIQRRAMAVGQWAEEMKKVGADEDWRDFLSSNPGAKRRSRGGFSSRLTKRGLYSDGSGAERELTLGGSTLRSRTSNHNTKDSEEIALLSTGNSLDGHDDDDDAYFQGRINSRNGGSGSSPKAYATALREICSKALAPITSSSHHDAPILPSNMGNDPNELSSSRSTASKGKQKAKSSLDEGVGTLPSIISNGTINRSQTPPLRSISPSSMSLLRTHAHSPPIRSPLSLGPSSPSSIVDMKEVDPFDSYVQPSHINGRRPSHPPFSSSKLAQSSSISSWNSNQSNLSSSTNASSHTSGSHSISKSRTGYETLQTPGASPPSSPSPQEPSGPRTKNLNGVLVQVG